MTMRYTRLGNSGLEISRIALGCMSFGDTSRSHMDWMLDDEQSDEIFRFAVESGITLWDTANSYANGSSEEIVGRAVRRYSRREDVVLATKVYFPMEAGPGGSGLSRRAIHQQVDRSLTRLQTDYVDLYQIHRFDERVPVEETMQALDDLVTAGKVRYLGASSMWAWQFAKMQHAADLRGGTRFISMQNHYNLLQREDEREMFGLLADQRVGSLVWSPLAKGLLARTWGTPATRMNTDPGRAWYLESDRAIVEAVQAVADRRSIPMAQVALAWVLRNPSVTAAIVGPTRRRHLEDAIASLDVDLEDEDLRILEMHYTPRDPTGF